MFWRWSLNTFDIVFFWQKTATHLLLIWIAEKCHLIKNFNGMGYRQRTLHQRKSYVLYELAIIISKQPDENKTKLVWIILFYSVENKKNPLKLTLSQNGRLTDHSLTWTNNCRHCMLKTHCVKINFEWQNDRLHSIKFISYKSRDKHWHPC